MIFGEVLKYLKAFCAVIQKNYGAPNGTSSLSDNTSLTAPSDVCQSSMITGTLKPCLRMGISYPIRGLI
jgi:hypothetical protein